ncbi:tetratricopeptide repeat protein 6 [Vombatus ursinus]|uniref:tetratricopeptide repeat protein 6 n=1 Tax=Vombatus ursinus TaxID=29139 RepID=UPI000FFD9810|nr:tetratricopeptide repeat protein 6 [Vombatus ursinus]
MSRVPKHFGLSYDEELKMLKELEKVRKQTRKDFLKFKLVQESKSKRSPLAFSALPRDFNNYSSQSSESSYEAIATDKIVPPEPCSSALQHTEKQSHDPRKKIQGSKLLFKESRKMTSLAGRPRNQTFCPKEFYLKNTAYMYQHGKEKPVIASLAGTSKQVVLFKQPAPPHKSRYPRVILRRRLPTPQFPLPLPKRDGKSEPSSVPNSYHAEEIINKEAMTSDHEAEKSSLRKRRWAGPRREGISYSSQAEKKRKKSFISSPIRDVKVPEEPAIQVQTVKEEEPQAEESEKKVPEMHLPEREVPRCIEEIIVSLQSERQSAVDKMIKDLIESILGQNYDIKMEVGQSEERVIVSVGIAYQQSTHTLHKLCTAAPAFVLPTDLQLASRIYHTIDKRGHDTFLGTTQNHHPEEQPVWRRDPPSLATTNTNGQPAKCHCDSISKMVPDDLQSNLNEVMIQREYVLKMKAQENTEGIDTNENLNVTAPSNLQEASIQHGEEKKTHPVEVRKRRANYIIFPKRRRRKFRKKLNAEKINSVLKELSKPPKTLERSASLVILWEQKKFFLHVPMYVRQSRCPSLPAVLHFDEFAQKHGGIPEDTDPQQWVSDFWIKELQDMPPTQELEHVEEKIIQTFVEPVKPEKVKQLQKIELDDFSNSDLSDVVRKHLETEIQRLTKEIKEKKKMAAFLYCRRGALYRKLGKLKKAMNDLQEAIFLEPLLLNAYWHRHFIYIFQDKSGDALNDLNYITKYNKNNADVYLSKAEIFRKRGNFTLALLNYSQAIKCRPTDDDIYFKRAEILYVGNKLLAIDDYSKCIYFNPERTDALLKRGLYHFESSNWNAAIQDFSSLLKFDCKNIQARTYRGRAFLKKGHYREATEDLSSAIHLDPNNWVAFYYRACILRKCNPHKSLQDFSVSVLINDTIENLLAFLHRGILYTEMSCWGLAVADFESVLELDRNISFAFINIGIIYLLHMDKYFEAIQQFTEAIRVDPLYIQSYLCRAQTYHKIQKLPEAVKDLSRAIHLQPDGIHLYIIRGRYLLEMKQYDLAKSTIFQLAKMNKGSLELSSVQQSLVFSFCNHHTEAIKILFSVTLCKPEPAMYMLLGKTQMKAKKIQNAVITFKRALDAITATDRTPKGSFLSAECYYHLGLCYMEEGNLQLAFDFFNKAVKVYPEYAEAFYQRGLCKVKLQKDKCVQDFNRAITINPKHYQAYISRAAFYGMKGRYSKAILNCSEAIRLFPNSVRAFLCRGVLKFYNKTYKLAITDLNIAISMDKACFLAFYNRAICYSKIKEFYMALRDYGIVLLLNVGDDIKAKTLVNRGLIYTELKMVANALEDFREAMQINKNDASLFQAAGICHHRLGEFEEAVYSFTRVIELNPFFVDAYVGRGNSYMEYGHEAAEKQAQKDFIKALHFNPAYPKARISFGYNLQARGKFQKAWNHFTICVDIDPRNCQAYEGRGIVCLQMGDNFAAIQDLNSALKITTSAEFLTNRGVIHEFMGERHIAMKDYQAALSINSKYSLAYFNAGNIYLHHRQFSQANDFYSKALEFDPLNDSAILNRGITNIILQKFEEAKEDFIKAIHLCPFWAAVYYNKAHLHYNLQQYETAEKDLSTALSLQPNNHLAYKLRADVRGKMGLIEEALKDYNQSLDLQEFAKV